MAPADGMAKLQAVGMTACDSRENPTACLEAEMSDVVIEPVKRHPLKEKVFRTRQQGRPTQPI
jgi:hypothetical protein